MRPGSGTINGGIAERYPEAKGAIIVIGVDSVEALMAAVLEAGGTEVMPVM
jgi:predicted enzyme related to lactoylglutathione lyase